ncbi:hypothetical protein [Abyssisolibacter fermentans]|uniref:hypothetical protein n=1 Tax=Abyssisolibacter fermentans TaxID=1766203 RepID=UPI00082CB198|nr:hypothetical protein [Abyssisolibacter fermentans]
MKKIIYAVGVVSILLVVTIFTTKNSQVEHTLHGVIQEIYDADIVIKVDDSPIDYSIIISENTVIRINDNIVTIEQLHVGSTIKVVYDGDIGETNPMVIFKCYSIDVVD